MTPDTGEAASPEPAAERLFLEHLARRERGEPSDLEVLCRSHPECANALRELSSRWEVVNRLAAEVHRDLTDEEAAVPVHDALVKLLATRTHAADRYLHEIELARGGQGTVISVLDQDLGRHVAMKVMHPRPPLGGPPTDPRGSRSLSRFLEEAQVTAQLEHPGIVPVHELGLNAEGRLYFTMKLVRGESLQEVLDRRSRSSGWSTTRILGVLLRVAEAMAFAHARRVIHRDLKPANVMLGDYGEVYVMDWGLARVAAGAEPDPADEGVRIPAHPSSAPDSAWRTHEGDVVGTPQYMAPEQAAGRLQEIGAASDVYAVGAMLYHALAGHAPYAADSSRDEGGPSSGAEQLLGRIRAGPPAPLRSLAVVPAELEAICERAMARDPRRRYPGMAELSTDLRAFLERRVVQAYETGWWAELRKWVLRHRALTVASAAALLALVGGSLATSRVAERGRERAVAAQQRADRSLAELLRLSDGERLKRLEREAEELWPADPGHVEGMKAWLAEARILAERTRGHRATLEALRARAGPYSTADARRDREQFPGAERLAAERTALDNLRALLERENAGEPTPRRNVIERKLGVAEATVARLEADEGERRTWRFDSEEDRWWHQTLTELIAGLVAFENTRQDVERRLARAQDLERISLQEPAELWDDAIESIANPEECPLYGGLHIVPQRGLVPLGRNQATDLWEFWDVQLGEEPLRREEDGTLLIAPETGVVFVLLPGGTFLLGAQSRDPSAPNYDRWADPTFNRVQEVRLDPFFMAAHELNQAQWERAMGYNPSMYQAPGFSAGNFYTETNPVESLTRAEAGVMARRFGFVLPTEAQWEYACRAGTTTTWWTGDDVASLRGAANIADAWLVRHAGGVWMHEPLLDDGHGGHAPVGTYRPNSFGLFEMIGNVTEWTRDPWAEPPPDAAPGDGAHKNGNPAMVCGRGGGWSSELSNTTSARRQRLQADLRADEIGLRLARRLQLASE